MSFEQPGYIRIPPSTVYGKLPKKPRADYSSKAWRNDLPDCATDHRKRPKSIYAKGFYPKVTDGLPEYPTYSGIKKKLVKQTKATMNPPPADASGKLIHVDKGIIKGKKERKRRASCKPKTGKPRAKRAKRK